MLRERPAFRYDPCASCNRYPGILPKSEFLTTRDYECVLTGLAESRPGTGGHVIDTIIDKSYFYIRNHGPGHCSSQIIQTIPFKFGYLIWCGRQLNFKIFACHIDLDNNSQQVSGNCITTGRNGDHTGFVPARATAGIVKAHIRAGNWNVLVKNATALLDERGKTPDII